MNTEREHLVAPCGIDCGNCEAYTCRDDRKLHDYLVSRGMSAAKLPCAGCRSVEGRCPAHPDERVCATYACVREKGVRYCHECAGFPCGMLHPSADRADVLPHNLKVFNLCFIRNKGIEEFIASYPEIKRKYYKGKMVIGQGPQI